MNGHAGGGRARRTAGAVGWVLGVLAGTAALFLGGLSRPLGGATGGIAVLLRHWPGGVLGAGTAAASSQVLARTLPAGVPAGASAAGGLLLGAGVASLVPARPRRVR